MDFNDICELLINKNIIKFGTFQLSDGSMSDYYFDMKKIYSDKELFNEIVSRFVSKIKSYRFDNYDYICGVPFGSIPLSTAIALKLNKPVLYIRKEKKNYGNKSQIEGNFNIGDTVLLIDDIITTGSNILKTKNILINNGLLPIGFAVFINKQVGGFNYIKSSDFNGVYIYNISDIIKNLHSNKLINSFDFSKYESSHMIENANFQNKIDKIKSNKDYLKKRDFEFNKTQQIILALIEEKKTNICLDLTDKMSWTECKNLIELLGPYIVLLKIDIESLCDFDNIKMFVFEIRAFIKKYKFIVINKCNYDITDLNKLYNSYLLYNEWATFVTFKSDNNHIELFNKINIHNDNEEVEDNLHISLCCLENFTSNEFSYEKLDFYDLEKYDDNCPIILSNNKICKNRINIYNIESDNIDNIETIINKKKYHLFTVGDHITKLYNEKNQDKLLKQIDLFAHKGYIFYKKQFNYNIELDLQKEFELLFKINYIEEEQLDKEELYGKIRKELEEEQEEINLKHNKIIETEIEVETKINTLKTYKYLFIGSYLFLLKAYYLFHHTEIFR